MLSRHIRAALVVHPRRFIHPSPNLSNSKPPHNPDSYNKDVDATPPADANIHRVDPTSEAAQKPYEAPSGPWSRAGTQTNEYRSVDKDTQPYAAPGENRRYGGKEAYAKEKGQETSQSGEGPEGKAKGGIKPERKR
jgi:hypothetical protein